MKVEWGRLMRLGLGGLHLRPAEFWALTPAEFLTMAGVETQSPMGRGALETLAALYPDERENDDANSDGY